MATDLTVTDVRGRLQSSQPLGEDAFEVLRFVAHSIQPNGVEAAPDSVELAIRLLERRDELAAYEEVIEAILRAVGLFPYLRAQALPVADQIALEAHRPLGMNDLVFHRVQAELYRRLLEGENIMLSAPTSFGKSLIVDGLLASEQYDQVAIVVPTLALIDETRRRLSRFADSYKLITHPSQDAEARNVYVMTQERLLDLQAMPQLDLFIIDEFYKLDARRDKDRSSLLNSAFRRLWKTNAQFLLLGPSIQGVTEVRPSAFRATFFHTDFRTVAADVTRIRATRDDEAEKLVDVMSEVEGPTLLFCRSPARARSVAEWLIEASRPSQDARLGSAIDWLAEQFHPDWYVIEALRRGVGVHHGKLPRSLAQWMVRAFNDGRLKTLVCTSTLIEGVNTRAKNVVIFDRTIARTAYDYFTFNNISGRSGRMFHHFVGKVILFHEPPDPDLPILDIPSLSQSDNADDSLLLQLDAEELTPKSVDRLAPFFDQEDLSIETLRDNAGVDPDKQLATARRLKADRDLAADVAWSGYPTYDELVATSDLLLRTLKGQTQRIAGVSSGAQLAFLTNRASRYAGDVKGLIMEELRDKSVNDAVEDTLDFLRYWPGHNFPRYLLALDRIQKEVLPTLRIRPGDYRFYAARAESMFMPGHLHALEEYGVPLQLALKMSDLLSTDGTLDDMLHDLGRVDPESLNLHPFEVELLRDAVDHLGSHDPDPLND